MGFVLVRSAGLPTRSAGRLNARVAAPDRSRTGPRDDSRRCAAGPANHRDSTPCCCKRLQRIVGAGRQVAATGSDHRRHQPAIQPNRQAQEPDRPGPAAPPARRSRRPMPSKGLGQVAQQLIERTCQHRRPRHDHIIVARAGRSREHLANRRHQPPARSIAGNRLANSLRLAVKPTPIARRTLRRRTGRGPACRTKADATQRLPRCCYCNEFGAPLETHQLGPAAITPRAS